MRRLLLDPVILAALGVNGVVAVLSLVPMGDPNLSYLLLDAWALVPISLLAAIAPWVGLPAMGTAREKLFWGLWSLSLLVHLAVRIVYIVLPGVDSAAPGTLAVDFLYLLFYLPLVLSILVRPDLPPEEGTARDTWVLECCGTIIFTLALLAYFAVAPRVFNQAEYETRVPSLLMYWVFDAYLLITFFYLRQTTPSREWRILFTWLALAPACWVITHLLELTFYLDWEGEVWPASPWDVLWYVPWLVITVGGRVRAAPLPALFGAGRNPEDEAELSRSLGRPGWLLAAALVLPIMHITTSLLGVLDPSTRNLRELVVLASLAILLGMAFVHQKLLESRSLALTRRSREMEARQRLLAAALEQFPDGVLIADWDGIARYGNRALGAMVGSLDETLGRPLDRALPKGSDPLAREGFLEALAGGNAWEGRATGEGRGEEHREEAITLSPVRDGKGTGVHWVLIRRDVTHLNELERRSRQAEKLETLGSLAREIDRELNQVLGEVFGYGEVVMQEIDPASTAHKDLRGLLAATERAADLAGRVIALSRQEEEPRGFHSLASVAREALALSRPTLPPSIRLVERIDDGTGEFRGVRSQLRQVVINLVSNGVEAMAGRDGVLEVGVGRVEVGEEEAREVGLPRPGTHLRLSVRDTGHGMDETTRRKIFDPFFSTKEPGAGTGLGLYLVRGTVTGHGGAIRVGSRPGAGAFFEIFLPPADSP